MSSGTEVNMGAATSMLNSVTPQVVSDGESNFMSERQQGLDILWRHYRCASYDTRKTNWDGSPFVPKIERERIGTMQYTPAGFYDNGSTAPLSERRPSAPYYLGKVIVDRFTGLLFSERRHPKIRCKQDPKTEAWLLSFAKATRLHQRMILGRTYGGAMGAVAMGFKFVHGKPVVEVHDPRYCTPEFSDRSEFKVDRLEKLYQFSEQIRDPATGDWIDGWFWYRRVIDSDSDTIWSKVPVDTNEQPDWENCRHIKVEHKLGFCPVVWIQNSEVQESIDGDPDCYGAFDNIEEMDTLIAQANRGIKANCDPTLVVSTDAEIDGAIQKGSSQAIVLPGGGSATYLELTGSGPKAAMEQAGELERRVLRVTRCVLDDNFAGPARTEEEVKQNYSNMLERADTMREQYGERGIKRLLEMALEAVRKLEAAVPDESAEAPEEARVVRLVRRKVILPPGDDSKPVEVGEGTQVDLDWPDYYEPSLERVSKAVEAAKSAWQAGLIDEEHALEYVAQYFDVDVAAMLQKWELERAAAAAPVEEGSTETAAEPGSVQDAALNGAQIGAVVEMIELCASGGLPRDTVANLINLAVPSVSVERAKVILGTVGTPMFKPVAGADPAAAYTAPKVGV